MELDIIKECKGAVRIGITGHVRPDGDCVGAVLSLQQYLEKGCPDAQVTVYLEKPSDIFREIKGYERIDSTFCAEKDFDVFFVLDCSQDRTGEAQALLDRATKVINIDHHVTNPGCGSIHYIRPEVGSVCEVLYDLYDKKFMDVELAKAVYIGMIHDTGVFQYTNTTPDTLRKAGELIRYGFDFAGIIQETFYQKSYVQAQIMGRALMESIRFMDGKCIVSALDKRVMDFYEVGPADLDGIVSQLRNIRGISCAIFMYQTGVLEYKVSMRSDESIDVAKVAGAFGGGGHARAAGCTMKGTFHDCVNNLSQYIAKQLEE